MDVLKRIRTPVRTSIMRTIKAISDELQKLEPDLETIENLKEKLDELKLQEYRYMILILRLFTRWLKLKLQIWISVQRVTRPSNIS